MQKVWDEIRRRNLHRVTAAYAVVAWVLVQGAGIAFPAFDLPGWAVKLLIILLIIGLPVLWVGLWLAHPPPRSKRAATAAPMHGTEWVLIGLLGVVLLASAGEFAYSQFKAALGAGTDAAAPQDASIAVLAFNNMSGDAGNDYFGDGISEELLNDLAQVPGLRVAGRTSSFSFKGKSATIEEIGKALNVHAVLEGSVRREGNRVRITAQLVNATNDYHMWSHDYDRDLSDIFAVQDEISHAITKELTGRLLGKQEADTAATPAPASAHAHINPDAYTAYLQGRFFFAKRNKDSMYRAVDFFRQAIKLEPGYADAHGSLALTYILLYGNGQARDTLGHAQEEVTAALKLDPDNYAGLTADGLVHGCLWNWSEADAAFQKLVRLYPNNPEARHFYGNFFYTLGLNERALAEQRKAAALDPLSAINRDNVGEMLHALTRDAEATAEYKQALSYNTDFDFALGDLCVSDADIDKIQEAKDLIPRIIAIDGKDGLYTGYCRFIIAYREHDVAGLKKLAAELEQQYAKGDMPAGLLAFPYAEAGDYDRAMHWLEKAYDERDPFLTTAINDPDIPAALKATPRYQAFMQRPLMQDLAKTRATVEARGTGG